MIEVSLDSRSAGGKVFRGSARGLGSTARLRRFILAHGFASVEHGGSAPALGGCATARAGELCQVMEGWLSVHRHCGKGEEVMIRQTEAFYTGNIVI